MKINVGPEARILGTKKVSSTGTVAGLGEFSGKDVLIVVPTRTPRYVPSVEDVATEVRSQVVKQGRIALKEFRGFRQKHLKSRVPGAQKLLQVAPRGARPAILKADAWVRASAARIEKRAERLLSN